MKVPSEGSGSFAMNSNRGNLRFNKVIEILICFGGLGVLGLNVLLLRQNQSLQNTLAPQIAAGAHLERLAGLALDGRIAPVTLPPPGLRALFGVAYSELAWVFSPSVGVPTGRGRM